MCTQDLHALALNCYFVEHLAYIYCVTVQEKEQSQLALLLVAKGYFVF